MLWTWSRDARITVKTADCFFLADRGFVPTYCSQQHHSLHVYHYDATWRLGDKEHQLKPGMATITPLGVPSRYDLPQEGEHWCVHFSLENRGTPISLPVVMDFGSAASAVHKQLAHISQLFVRSFKGASTPELNHHAANTAFQALLLWLAALQEQQTSTPGHARTEASVDVVAAYIRQHVASTLTVPFLAKKVGMSQNYLARCFRKHMGVTIPAYILYHRIAAAKELLRISDLSIKEVADRAGMPNAQHFNKQFRRLAGVSPTAYRIKYLDGHHRQ